MNLNRQAKILRVLQDQHFIRISGSKALSADCGIIAATNEKLQELITKGLLWEDLYDRLSVIPEQYHPLLRGLDEAPLDVRCQASSREIILEALERGQGIKQKAAELR